MAEYVNKVGLLTRLKKKKSFGELTAKEAIRTVEAEQTIDIVHCSECVWHTPIRCEYYPIEHKKESYWCSLFDIYTPKDFFCKGGKEKE